VAQMAQQPLGHLRAGAVVGAQEEDAHQVNSTSGAAGQVRRSRGKRGRSAGARCFAMARRRCGGSERVRLRCSGHVESSSRRDASRATVVFGTRLRRRAAHDIALLCRAVGHGARHHAILSVTAWAQRSVMFSLTLKLSFEFSAHRTHRSYPLWVL
jgi:hypothetical protein